MPESTIIQIGWLNIILLVVIPVVSALIAIISLCYVRKSNQRAEKLFGSQIRPLIQDRPLDLVVIQQFNAIETILEVVNYSGFDAYNISFDLKYGSNYWISEWIKAKLDALAKIDHRTEEEEELYKFYSVQPKEIKNLGAGDSVKRHMRGSLNIDAVCNSKEGFDVLVRTIWKNERGHTFDRIRKYKLLCTSVDGGRSFTFIPQQIVSQEE